MDRQKIQNEAIKLSLLHKRLTLAISVGVGKTYIGLQYLKALKYIEKNPLKILIVCPKNSIIDSWKLEADKFNLTNILNEVTFSTYLSLNKQDNDYDVIILDEVHSLLFSHEEYLKNCKSRILGLTGTPPKNSSSEKGIMINRYCPIQYEYLVTEAVNDKLLNDYKIFVHFLKLNTAKELQINYKSGSFLTSEVSNYLYWCTRVDTAVSKKSKQIASVMRMKAMMEYPSKEKYAKELLEIQNNKTIVFCNTQAQADRICLHSYHSGNKDSEDNLLLFKEGTIQKLSCVLQLNEGVNISNLKSGIIMHSYGNERKAQQRIGRLLRLNPKETSVIHILCYKNTVDENWVKTALEDYDQNKIIYLNN